MKSNISGSLREAFCFAVLAAVALALVGCGKTESTGSAEIKVHAQPYIKPVYEHLVTQFMTEHPHAAATFNAGPREEDQMVQQLLRTKLIGGAVPDVVFVSGNQIRLLVDRGMAVALDPFIEADPQWDAQSFAPAIAEAGRIDGKTYGLAFGFSMPVVLFNSELLQRAGVGTDDLPASWGGITALAKKINDPQASVLGGFLEYDNGGAFSFLFLLESYGGDFLTKDEKKVAFDDAHGLAALNVLRDFGEAGQAQADMTRDQARQAFGAGSIGIFVTMSSMIPRLEQAAAGHFNIVSVPIPIEPRDGKVPMAGPVAVMLAKDPAKQRATYELMKFACGPKGQATLAAGSGYVPANQAAIRSSPALRETLAGRLNAHSYVERLQDASAWYAPPGENAIKITDVVSRYLQKVATLEMSPHQALTAMSQDIERLLPQTVALN